MRALTEPPPAVPLAAELELDARRMHAVQLSSRNATLGLLTYWLYVPIGVAMGIRHLWMAAVMAASIIVLTWLTYHYSRHPPRDLRPPLLHVAASTVAMFTGVWAFGSFVLLPMIVLVNGVGYVSTFPRHLRLFIVQALVVMFVPLGLQLAGVLDPSYVIDDGTLRVLPQLLDFPSTATWIFLIVTHGVIIAACLAYVTRLRRALEDAQRELQVQAWYLAQLVPMTPGPRPP